MDDIDPTVLLADDVPVLTEEQLDALPEDLREEYLAALAAEVEETPLTPPQRRCHDLCMAVDEVLYGGAAGGGKMVTLRTQIPTPSGFRAVGDLEVGDDVLGRDGKVHQILGLSEIQHVQGWRFTFDDGSTVDSNDDHRWLTFDTKELDALTRRSPEFRARRRSKRESRATGRRSEAFTASITARNQASPPPTLPAPAGSVRTTAEIVETLTVREGRANHAIPVCEPVDLPEKDLPLDPYLFGCWLGDGSAGQGVVTSMDDEIVQAFVDGGFPVAHVSSKPDNKASMYRFAGLREVLTEMGVKGNKHVPHDYLWGSIEQRKALLAGLIDTDGTVSHSGSPEFCNTNKDIVDAVTHLVRSLGMKCVAREGRAMLYGVDHGPKWTIKFSAPFVAFRLTRKAERQVLATRRTTRFRYIKKAERLDAQLMRCLMTSAPDSLFLCTESFIPTHNSFLAVWHADWCSRQFDHHRTLILRSSLPELRRTIMVEARRVIDMKEYPGVKWRAADKEYHYGNGSIIELGYCESDDDVRQYLSAEYDCIIIDESTDMSRDQIEMLRSRLRTTRKKREAGVNVHLLLLSNPGGISHAFHRDRYVKQTSDGMFVASIDERDDKGRGRNRDVAFVPARVGDNPFIDEDYVANLAAISDPVKRAQYLDGDWSTFEGQFFQEWDPEIHTCEPFQIPESWPKIGGYDWGYAAPACLLVAAIDPDRTVHVFWEMYVEQHTAGEQGRIFLEFLRESRHKVDFIAGDPSIWNRTGVGIPISAQLREAGIGPLRRASNARVDGWSQIREYLSVDPELERPRIAIHRTCENLIRTLPELPRDKLKPEDVNTRSEDHAADALRYLLMMRPRVARLKKPGPQTHQEKVIAAIERRSRVSKRPVHDVLGRL